MQESNTKMNVVCVNLEVDCNSYFAVLRDDYIELYNEKQDYIYQNKPIASFKISEHCFKFEENELLIYDNNSFRLNCKMLFPSHFSLLRWFHHLKVKGKIPSVFPKNKSVNHLNYPTNYSTFKKKIDELNNSSNKNLDISRSKSFQTKYNINNSKNIVEFKKEKPSKINSPSSIKKIKENKHINEEEGLFEYSDRIKIEDNLHKVLPNCFEKKDLPFFGIKECSNRPIFLGNHKNTSLVKIRQCTNEENKGSLNIEEKRRKLIKNSQEKERKNFETTINCFKNKFSTIIDNTCIISLKKDEKIFQLKKSNNLENTNSLLSFQDLQSRNNTNNERKSNKLIFSHFSSKLNLKYNHPINERKPDKISGIEGYSEENLKKYKENNFLIKDYKTSFSKDTKINNSVKYISLRDDMIDSYKKFGMNRNISS